VGADRKGRHSWGKNKRSVQGQGGSTGGGGEVGPKKKTEGRTGASEAFARKKGGHGEEVPSRPRNQGGTTYEKREPKKT